MKIDWKLTQKWAKICKFSKNANFHYSSLLLPSVGVGTKNFFFQKLPWHVLITLESKNNNIFPKYRFAVVRGFKNLKVVCPYIQVTNNTPTIHSIRVLSYLRKCSVKSLISKRKREDLYYLFTEGQHKVCRFWFFKYFQ